ncbi:MAG: hypothetical protein QXG39_07150 [Candidatus Aenigmatarchaeota archaeon]
MGMERYTKRIKSLRRKIAETQIALALEIFKRKTALSGERITIGPYLYLNNKFAYVFVENGKIKYEAEEMGEKMLQMKLKSSPQFAAKLISKPYELSVLEKIAKHLLLKAKLYGERT